MQAGRAFTGSDSEHAPLVVVVSRAFADRYWPAQDAVGKRLKLARYESQAPWRTVVGVVNDVQHAGLTGAPRPVVYFPHAQGPEGGMDIVVRTAGDPAVIAGGVREAIQRLDPDLPVSSLRPMKTYVSAALGDTELALSLRGDKP